MSIDGREDVAQVVERIRASEPRTPEEVREQLNLIEYLVSLLTPQDNYEAAILEALNEMNVALQELVDNGMATPGPGPGEPLPDDVVPLLQGTNMRLEEIVQGIVDTSQLPVGLQGTAAADIPNGSEGVATFDFSGGRYAAMIEADSQIGQFERVRIKGPGNLATSIPTEEQSGPDSRTAENVYDRTVNAAQDILSTNVRPNTGHSSFRVNVTLDTSTEFAVRTIPDDGNVSAFDGIFNNNNSLQSGNRYEFQFDVSQDAQYNFRAPNAGATVNQIRVQEVFAA